MPGAQPHLQPCVARQPENLRLGCWKPNLPELAFVSHWRVSVQFRELIMKKTILIGLAILAVSTSGAFAAKHKMKPKAPAAAAAPASPSPMMGQVSAADKAMYMKNQHDSGMKKK
jgi:hypothetical protein